jgi:hypothetical protein
MFVHYLYIISLYLLAMHYLYIMSSFPNKIIDVKLRLNDNVYLGYKHTYKLLNPSHVFLPHLGNDLSGNKRNIRWSLSLITIK